MQNLQIYMLYAMNESKEYFVGVYIDSNTCSEHVFESACLYFGAWTYTKLSCCIVIGSKQVCLIPHVAYLDV